MRDGYTLRAVLPGGASTPLLPAADIDVPMDFDHMKRAGTAWARARRCSIDDSVCPVGLCLNLLRFFAQESCGWCTPCWAGLPWAVDVLNDIEEGRGRPEQLDLLVEQMLVHGRADVLLRPRAERHQAAGHGAEAVPRRLRAPHRRATAAATARPTRRRGARPWPPSPSPSRARPTRSTTAATCSTSASRWATTCPTSAGTRPWARSAPAGSAPSSSTGTTTTTRARSSWPA